VNLPLLRDLSPDRVFAFDRHGTVSVGQFLADVERLAALLPERRYLLNDCADRYHFLVGLGAALVREQVSLFPSNRVAHVWGQLSEDYPDCFCLTDQADAPAVMDVLRFPPEPGPLRAGIPYVIPEFPASRVVAIAFTSGSTGRPKPVSKRWGTFVNEARSGGASLGLDAARPGAIVATVPAQHMYGFIASIMLPLQWGYAVNRDKPFYPEDIRLSLEASPVRPVLVITPVQLRACVMEKAKLPPLDFILSSAAPLPRPVADEAEALFGARVEEYYGTTETGAIARRRQQQTESWRTFDGVRVRALAEGFEVESDYFETVVLNDVADIESSREFRLIGRNTDLVKIGGKRTSLIHLNQLLQEIDGVVDGAFLLEEGQGGREPRLSVFVVAPERTREAVLAALRMRLDDVFMPRKLWLVEALPRNATGKLPRENILRLRDEMEHQTP
jgi:acyl-coenzyme A synthetase/AMP-(fatty) acid ligase